MTERQLVSVPVTIIKSVQAYGQDVLAMYGDEMSNYEMPVDSGAVQSLLRSSRALTKRLEDLGVTCGE